MSRITRRTVIPVNQITPFTYRDGVTYIQLLTELSEYIKSVLHPSLQHTVDQLVADVESQMNTHHDQYVDGVQEFQRIHDAFMSDVNAKLIALNDSAVSDLVQDTTSLLAEVLREVIVEGVANRVISQDTTYQIPDDFPDIQSALDHISSRSITSGVQVTINLQPGHQPSTGAQFQYADYGHVRITASDSVVHVDNTFTGPWIEGYDSTLPVLACLIDMHGYGGDGYAVRQNSSGYVEPNCGTRNAGERGLYITQSSSCYGVRSEFTGSHDRNVWVSRTSVFDGDQGNFSANQGGDNAVYVSRGSTVNIMDADVSNAFNNGITLARSVGVTQGCDVSNAGGSGVIVGASSRISGKYMIVNDCQNYGVDIREGSIGDISFSEIKKCGSRGVNVNGASNIDGRAVVVEENVGNGVVTIALSSLNLNQAVVRNNGGFDVVIGSGGSINTANATIGRVNVNSLNEVTSNGIVFG